jgi:hypothetical protein
MKNGPKKNMIYMNSGILKNFLKNMNSRLLKKGKIIFATSQVVREILITKHFQLINSVKLQF